MLFGGFLQLAINAEQKLEIDRLRRELDSTRAELTHANSLLQSKEVVGKVQKTRRHLPYK